MPSDFERVLELILLFPDFKRPLFVFFIVLNVNYIIRFFIRTKMACNISWFFQLPICYDLDFTFFVYILSTTVLIAYALVGIN